MASRRKPSYSEDDYYSDDFVSDDDTRGNKRWTPMTTDRHKGRGRGRGKGAQTTRPAREPEIDNITKRVLSARRLKINELRNAIDTMNQEVKDLKEENKLLKKTQLRQEKALERFEDKESDLPQLMQRHNNEVRALKEQLRKTRDKYEKTDRYLRDAEDELEKMKSKVKKLKTLVEEKDLVERDELSRKLRQAELDLEERDVKVRELEKHVEHLQKNHRHELGIEMARQREANKQLQFLRLENEKMDEQLKSKMKELDLKNIYANRQYIPKRAPASYSGTPHDTPPPRARKRAPSLSDITPRERAKQFEEKRREELRKKQTLRERGNYTSLTSTRLQLVGAESPKRSGQHSPRVPAIKPRRDRVDAPHFSIKEEKGKVSAFEPVSAKSPLVGDSSSKSSGPMSPPVPATKSPEHVDAPHVRVKKESHAKLKQEAELRMWEEEERKRKEEERKEREERERLERERRDREMQEEADQRRREWEMKQTEMERENRTREERERKRRQEEERQRLEHERRGHEERERREKREREERVRREKERLEQERRASEEHERFMADEEERKKKDLILMKLREIDEGKNKETKTKKSDPFFVTNPRPDSNDSLGSKKSYKFSRPVENMHNGKPANADRKKQFGDLNDLEQGGYNPSFGGASRSGASEPKTSLFDNKAVKKSNLLEDLFGGQAKDTKSKKFDEDLVSPKASDKKPTRTTFPWDEDSKSAKTRSSGFGAVKRENSSTIFGGGNALIDDDEEEAFTRTQHRRPLKSSTTTFQARPAVTAVDHHDDDIEEVIL